MINLFYYYHCYCFYLPFKAFSEKKRLDKNCSFVMWSFICICIISLNLYVVEWSFHKTSHKFYRLTIFLLMVKDFIFKVNSVIFVVIRKFDKLLEIYLCDFPLKCHGSFKYVTRMSVIFHLKDLSRRHRFYSNVV